MSYLKKFWPIGFIFIIWFIFSSPYFIQNKIPFASDYLVNFFSPWNSYHGFASAVKNNAMSDVIGQILPWKAFTVDSLKNGIIPLWNPYSFSGTPHLANYQSAVLSPLNLIFFVLPFVDAWSILVLFQPLLAGIFMLVYLRSLNLNSESALFGSVSFMFCGFITTWMGYATLGYAILFLPLALFFIEKFYKNKSFKYLLLLSLTFPLSFFSGHFQISLYFALMVSFYLIFKYFEVKDKNLLIYSLTYLIFGALLTLPQVLPSMEAYGLSLRSSIFQKLEVIPWSYIATFFAPDFFGNPVTRNDWFGHYAEWNGFIGTIGIILAAYSIFSIRNKKILFFLITALISIFLSFQSPLLDLLIAIKIPVLSTSAASRIIVLFSFSASVLAAFGINAFREDLEKRNIQSIVKISSIIIIILFILWISVFSNVLGTDKTLIARQNLILPTILSVLFIFVAVSAFWSKKLRLSIKLLMLAIVLLSSFDMVRFALKWQPFENKNLFYPRVAVVSELKKIKTSERALASFGAEAAVYYKVGSIEGYDAVYSQRYGEFISSLNNGKLQNSARSVVNFPKYGQYSSQGLNLLGVQYLIHKRSDGYAVWEYPFWKYPEIFQLKYEDEAYQIFNNTQAFPKAFLAKKFIVKKNSQEILSAMFSKDMDLKDTIILEESPQNLPAFSNGEAKIKHYGPNKVEINTQANGSSLLFLSDSYYPGWIAYIDGVQTKIIRGDYAFKTVFVPKGSHKVEFIYSPNAFKLGVLMAALGLVLALIWFKLKGLFIFPKI